MTALVEANRAFGDLVIEEEFDFAGKKWRTFLLVPQEHLEDLFHTPTRIKPSDAYDRDPEFWKTISELTRDFYKEYLATQVAASRGGLRRQWFQWKDFERLEEAYRTFKSHTNRPIRLSIVARDPVH